jgi:hypothetical protein
MSRDPELTNQYYPHYHPKGGARNLILKSDSESPLRVCQNDIDVFTLDPGSQETLNSLRSLSFSRVRDDDFLTYTQTIRHVAPRPFPEWMDSNPVFSKYTFMPFCARRVFAINNPIPK